MSTPSAIAELLYEAGLAQEPKLRVARRRSLDPILALSLLIEARWSVSRMILESYLLDAGFQRKGATPVAYQYMVGVPVVVLIESWISQVSASQARVFYIEVASRRLVSALTDRALAVVRGHGVVAMVRGDISDDVLMRSSLEIPPALRLMLQAGLR